MAVVPIWKKYSKLLFHQLLNSKSTKVLEWSTLMKARQVPLLWLFKTFKTLESTVMSLNLWIHGQLSALFSPPCFAPCLKGPWLGGFSVGVVKISVFTRNWRKVVRYLKSWFSQLWSVKSQFFKGNVVLNSFGLEVFLGCVVILCSNNAGGKSWVEVLI